MAQCNNVNVMIEEDDGNYCSNRKIITGTTTIEEEEETEVVMDKIKQSYIENCEILYQKEQNFEENRQSFKFILCQQDEIMKKLVNRRAATYVSFEGPANLIPKMIANGFYCLNEQSTRCAFCAYQKDDWNRTDDVDDCHYKNTLCGRRIFKPQYADIRTRYSSFVDHGWNPNVAEMLARAFFYFEKNSRCLRDTVKCYHCGVSLNSLTEVPIKEHLTNNPTCILAKNGMEQAPFLPNGSNEIRHYRETLIDVYRPKNLLAKNLSS